MVDYHAKEEEHAGIEKSFFHARLPQQSFFFYSNRLLDVFDDAGEVSRGILAHVSKSWFPRRQWRDGGASFTISGHNKERTISFNNSAF